jgi:hypothetical protein
MNEPVLSSRRPSESSSRVRSIEALEDRCVPAVSVVTYHNDLALTGQNLAETSLTYANVNVNTFGKQRETAVDGQVYAQPLYVPNFTINVGANAGTHNVVFVATQHNSVYAVSADTGTVLWQRSFINPAAGITPVPQADMVSEDITPEAGITSTPGIDLASNTIFVVARTKEIRGGTPHFVQTLYALDMSSGATKGGGPRVIADTIFQNGIYTYVSGPTINGTGDGSVGGRLTYNALRQNQRPALTVYGDTVYVMSASHGDNGPYHGWILGYDKSTLALKRVFNTTPNGAQGGIWMAGAGLSIDAQGFFYFGSSNGSFGDEALDANGFPINGNYANSIIKLAVDPTSNESNPNVNGWGFRVVDYFTPYNQETLSFNDLNLGSGGITLLPDSVGSAAHPRLLITGGKHGSIYLIDRDNMGKYSPTEDRVVQRLDSSVNGVISTPAYFNGALYFVGSYTDFGKRFTISNADIQSIPASQTSQQFLFPGSTPAISANGTSDAIVWMLERGSRQLRAYRAGDLNQLLWHSEQAGGSRDQVTGGVVKFTTPTVADGRVFVGSANALVIYGLLDGATTPPTAPTNLTATALSGTQVRLGWIDRSANETGFRIERSTNGVNYTVVATTTPNSTEFLVGSLQPNTTYSFRVRAFNGVGESTTTNVVTVTTPNATSGGIDFSNGFTGAGSAMQLNSAARIVGDVLRLTDGGLHQRSSAFFNTPVNITQFTSQFTIKMTRLPGVQLGDGIVFVIQNAGPTALGPGGGGIGYGRVTQDDPPGIPTSVAIKFDTIFNAGEGNNSTGLYTNGQAPTVPSIDLTGTGIDLQNGNNFVVTLVYDGATMSVQIRDEQTGALATQTYSNLNIPQIVGGTTAYVGFTSSTGESRGLQDVLDWTMAPLNLPLTPTNLSATVGTSQVTLRWDPVANATSYNVYRSTTSNGQGATPYVVGVTSAAYTDTAISNGTTYYYKVTAVSNQGESGRSAEVAAATVTFPARPSDQSAASVTMSSLVLNWKLNSTNETGVRILRRDGFAGTFNAVAVLPPGSTTYTDTNLQPGELYSYHIVAFNGLGFSDFAGVLVRTLSAAPLGLNAEVAPSSITLRWLASFGATGYDVFASSTPGQIDATSTPIAQQISSTSFVETFSGNLPRYYRVRAVNESGAGPLSAEFAVTSRTGVRFDLGWFENGRWILDTNFNGARDAGDLEVMFGQAGDLPVVGDWNGDGVKEIGVFRQGDWFLETNGIPGFRSTDTTVRYGVAIDLPIVGDWNGDGRDDLGVFRLGVWHIDTNGVFGWQGDDTSVVYGVPIDLPVAGDWDGDGRDNIGTVRDRNWYLDTNGIFGWQGDDTSLVYGVGTPTDTPVIGDWDGDGQDEIGVYRRNGHWYLDANGTLGWQGDDRDVTFDIGSAIPVSGASATPNLLAGGVGLSAATSSAARVTNVQLARVVDQALAIWSQAGLPSRDVERLRRTPTRVVDVANDGLALSWARAIAIDVNAAGRGWNVDDALTPDDADRFDLLSAVLHEQGHILGLEHIADADDFMSETLPTGVRRLPTRATVERVLAPR